MPISRFCPRRMQIEISDFLTNHFRESLKTDAAGSQRECEYVIDISKCQFSSVF